MLDGEFDIDEARETFSNMVLLEVIKRGRSKVGDTLVAGDMEAQLAEKPESMVRRMRDYPEVKAVCDNMTLDNLRQFVQDGTARTVAKQILQNAKEHNSDAKVNGLQKQNEQEMQPKNIQM
jgi:hypothetical protein